MASDKKPTNIFEDKIRKVVKQELVPVREEIKNFKEEFNEFKNKSEERHNMVMIALDKVVGMFNKHEEEHAIISDDHRRLLELEDKVDNLVRA